MQTPLKLSKKSIHIGTIELNFSKLFNYSVLIAFAIVLGSILQIFFPLDRIIIGKNSILTGLPIIRTALFIFPILITFGLFLWSIIIFNNSEVSNSMDNNIWRFLNKIYLGFLITNLTHVIIFYFLYLYLYVPLWDNNQFKLSGHVLATMFAGAILTNLEFLCEMYISENIKKKLMGHLLTTIKFLEYHNVYTVIWTAWVFHRIRETVFSFFIVLVWISVINSLHLDRLIVFLFRTSEIKVIKEKNKIYQSCQ